MKVLVLDKAALRHNIAQIKAKAGRSGIYAVLTGDGHGAGLVSLAKLLRGEGIGRFAVSEPEDVSALRKAGLVDEEILMLRSTADPEELEELVDVNAVCTVGSTNAGVALNKLAESRSTIVEAHIQIDTGMGFGGFLAEEPDKVLAMYQNLPNVALSGIYTQIHAADGARGVEQQLFRFDRMCRAIHAAGYETGCAHAAGSSAFMRYGAGDLDAVRVGSAILGRCAREKGDGLETVGLGVVRLGDIRWMPKGHTVGASSLVKLKRNTRVGVIPVGYQNGFGVTRARESGLWGRSQGEEPPRFVTVGDQRARILGDIGAMETLLDLTELKCSSGDLVQFDIDPLYAKGLKRVYQ